MDGRHVVTVANDKSELRENKDEAWIWDTAAGDLVPQVLKYDGSIRFVAFSPNGQYIVTAGTKLGTNAGQAKIWDVESRRPIATVEHKSIKQDGYVDLADFSPDSRRLVTASTDGTARIWDTITGKELGPAFEQDYRIEQVLFSPDGQRLLTLCNVLLLPEVRLWNIATRQFKTIFREQEFGSSRSLATWPGFARLELRFLSEEIRAPVGAYFEDIADTNRMYVDLHQPERPASDRST
jgi:WD40 repeat protein